MKAPSFASLNDPDFDPVKRYQDRVAFVDWAESLRNEAESNFRTTDAVICELAHYSLQRSLKRSIPPDWKWRVELSDERIRVVVVAPSGVETAFSDSCLGIVIYQVERADWRALAAPVAPLPLAPQPFRFVDVDPNDPFERARAEILAKRMAA